jgi:chromosome segregation ATPase
LKKWSNKRKKLEDDIKDYEKRIEEAKKDITTNVEDQKALMKKIEEQKGQIESVNKKLGDIN